MPTSSNVQSEGPKAYATIPPAQGIYEESTTQHAPLGYRIAFSDGRVYRYASNGTVALSPGQPVKPELIAQSSKACAAATAGTYAVTVTTTSAMTTLEDGYLMINDAAGEGIMYRIKEAVANATTSTKTDFTLYDPVATTLTTSSEATIIPNPYKKLIECSAITDTVMGIPPIAVTASTSTVTYYFWLQTWGLCPVYMEGTPVAGHVAFLGVGDGVAGATHYSPSIGTVTTLQLSGISIPTQVLGKFYNAVTTATEYTPIWLMLTP